MNGLIPEVGLDPRIFEHMAALADTVRCRMLLLLEPGERTVTELCTVLQLPQSTVSRHLKTLAEAGWVDSRKDGTRRLYRATVESLDDSARQLWGLTRDEVAGSSSSRTDRQRLQSVLASTDTVSGRYFAASADGWDARRDELFGMHFYLFGLIGLVDPNWVVGDLGCGTGPVAEALAPFVREVVAVDESDAMLAQAESRLHRFENVRVERGKLESLPLEDRSLDVATLFLVLHHVEDPARAIHEVARVLTPGGRLLVVDMLPHDRESYRQEMGHRWLGFSEESMSATLVDAGFESLRFVPLPPANEARGPNLFLISASLPREVRVESGKGTAE